MTAPSPENSTIVRAACGLRARCRPPRTSGVRSEDPDQRTERVDGVAHAPVVRPLDPEHAAGAVDAVFAGLSPQSRYLRFHSPVPRLPASVRDRLVDVDGVRHAAVVAVACDLGPIGLAEVFGDGQGTADVAVAVVDAWQRRGIGTRLLRSVAALAEAIGYTELRGSVLPENTAMRRLARRVLPWARPWYDGETVQFAAPIGSAAWTVTHEDLLADLLGR